MTTDTPAPTGPKFQIKKKLTLPTFKFIVDTPLYALFLGPIHRGTQRGQAKLNPQTGEPELPPMLAHIVNMETGEHGQIMIAEIIKTEISENFPNDGYVGHGFAITKQKRKEGKRYDPYNIDEIDVPAELQEVVKKFAKMPGTDATASETASAGTEPAPTDNPEAPKDETHRGGRRR